MNDQDKPIDQDDPFDDDTIDRIANFLPAEARAGFYRELRHCRSLPQNDEMLRIIRAMQYLVLIMVKLPEQMAVERQRFEQTVSRCEQLLGMSTSLLKKLPGRSIGDLHRCRLISLKALNPPAVAAEINESLRQQFIKTTIPETADALAVNAAQIKKATNEFVSATHSLNNAYDGAVVEAHRVIQNLQSTSSQAISGKQPRRRTNSWRWFVRIIDGCCLCSQPSAYSLASG